ncbi:mediator of DNA damage checkpoint protein 1-like [Hydractinia symbiolongicarpus]|uniref:mediator of DNA damage checkpoint protein 1-like n=1 Tax=Hydractinia symbiolongicarpus TaxID=13093 RepID=UPI0025504AEA|nr:mediator of DNA damage checkpoint protein 1-like [Hydractinia symbiolongicarpus]
MDATQDLDALYDEEVEKKEVGKLKTVKHRHFQETEFPIYEGINIIGRDDRSDIPIKVQALSKKHACIEVTKDSFLLCDLGSRNKTRKEKMVLKPLEKYELQSGDLITFADVTCHFEVNQENDSDPTGSMTESDTGSESMIPEDDEVDIGNAEEDFSLRLTVGDDVKKDKENLNVSDLLNDSDILLPTQNYVDQNSSFHEEMKLLGKKTETEDDLYAAETESESEGEGNNDVVKQTPMGKETVSIIGQTPGFSLSQQNKGNTDKIPESPVVCHIDTVTNSETANSESSNQPKLITSINIDSNPVVNETSDDLSCTFQSSTDALADTVPIERSQDFKSGKKSQESICDSDALADTLPIERSEDFKNAKRSQKSAVDLDACADTVSIDASNLEAEIPPQQRTIGRLLEQLADTVVIDRDVPNQGKKVDNSDEEDEMPSTYVFNDIEYEGEDENSDREEDGEKRMEEENLKENKLTSPAKDIGSFADSSQEIPYSAHPKKPYVTSTQLLESFQSFGTPESSINNTSAKILPSSVESNYTSQAKENEKMVVCDSDEESTQPYETSSPTKDVSPNKIFKVPSIPIAHATTLPGGCEYYDATDAGTHMSSSDDDAPKNNKHKDEGKRNDEEETQAYSSNDVENNIDEKHVGASDADVAATVPYDIDGATQGYCNGDGRDVSKENNDVNDIATQAYNILDVDEIATQAYNDLEPEVNILPDAATPAYCDKNGLDVSKNNMDENNDVDEIATQAYNVLEPEVDVLDSNDLATQAYCLDVDEEAETESLKTQDGPPKVDKANIDFKVPVPSHTKYRPVRNTCNNRKTVKFSIEEETSKIMENESSSHTSTRRKRTPKSSVGETNISKKTPGVQNQENNADKQQSKNSNQHRLAVVASKETIEPSCSVAETTDREVANRENVGEEKLPASKRPSRARNKKKTNSKQKDNEINLLTTQILRETVEDSALKNNVLATSSTETSTSQTKRVIKTRAAKEKQQNLCQVGKKEANNEELKEEVKLNKNRGSTSRKTSRLKQQQHTGNDSNVDKTATVENKNNEIEEDNSKLPKHRRNANKRTVKQKIKDPDPKQQVSDTKQNETDISDNYASRDCMEQSRENKLTENRCTKRNILNMLDEEKKKNESETVINEANDELPLKGRSIGKRNTRTTSNNKNNNKNDSVKDEEKQNNGNVEIETDVVNIQEKRSKTQHSKVDCEKTINDSNVAHNTGTEGKVLNKKMTQSEKNRNSNIDVMKKEEHTTNITAEETSLIKSSSRRKRMGQATSTSEGKRVRTSSKDVKKEELLSSANKRPVGSKQNAKSSSTCRSVDESFNDSYFESPRRQSLCTKPKIVFTGISDKTVEKIVKDLGGEVVDNVEVATHLVTDKVRRTVKFLCAVARGIPVVSSAWLKSSKTSNVFTSCKDHILNDQAAERQYKFQLKRSLKKSSVSSLLENVRIYVTKNVKPEPKCMKEMIECSGGKFLSKSPKGPSDDVIVVSCDDDAKEHEKLTNQGFCVCTNEVLLTGILRQEIDRDSFLINNESKLNESQDSTSKRKRQTTSTTTTSKRRR